MTRRDWIRLSVAGSFVAGSGSLVYARKVEPKWFDVSHTPIYLPKLRSHFRALHLADLHSSQSVPTWLLRQAVQTGIRTKPDIIFLTGDYISTLRAYDESGLLSLFKALANTAPAYAVMGNHDRGKADGETMNSSEHMQGLLRRGGIRVLMNEAETVEINGQNVTVAGLGDLWSEGEFQPAQAFSEVDGDLPTILLAHNPDTKKAVDQYPWDLMLCGHTHGGQVVFPMIHPFWLPVRDQRFIAGLYGWERSRQIYITRGVGSPTGIRFRCRPEVSVLEFMPALPGPEIT